MASLSYFPVAAVEASITAEKHIARALGALDDVSIRLEVAGERLTKRKDAQHAFGQVFLDVANQRQGGFGQAKWHLKEAIDEADDRVLEIIENGAAPFWEIVREAVDARVES
jgi:hypothetical protein